MSRPKPITQAEAEKGARMLARQRKGEAKRERGTKAQRELLAWMVGTEDKRTKTTVHPRAEALFRGGQLITFYEERAKARGETYATGGYANHGWRRAGGTALKRLADAGFALMIGHSIGVPVYILTEKGRKIGREVLLEREHE